MPRQPAKTIDQVEAEEQLTFLDDEVPPEVTPEATPVVSKREAPKEFSIRRHPVGLFHIAYTAGGEVPDLLKGGYTTSRLAQQAIDNYKAHQPKTA